MLHFRHRCPAHCNDEPRASPRAEKIPRPIQHYEETASESDEKIDVCEAPKHPGHKAAELDGPKLCYCVTPSDGRQHPEVPILERGNEPPTGAGGNDASHIGALLLGYRSDAGKWLSPDTMDKRRISQHEDLWTPGQREVRLDLDPSRPVGLRAEPLTGQRTFDASRPYYRPTFDPLGSHSDSRCIAAGHRGSQTNFGTQLLEGSLSGTRNRFIELTQKARPSFNKYNLCGTRINRSKIRR